MNSNIDERQTFMEREGDLRYSPYYQYERHSTKRTLTPRMNWKANFRNRAIQYYVDGDCPDIATGCNNTKRQGKFITEEGLIFLVEGTKVYELYEGTLYETDLQPEDIYANAEPLNDDGTIGNEDPRYEGLIYGSTHKVKKIPTYEKTAAIKADVTANIRDAQKWEMSYEFDPIPTGYQKTTQRKNAFNQYFIRPNLINEDALVRMFGKKMLNWNNTNFIYSTEAE